MKVTPSKLFAPKLEMKKEETKAEFTALTLHMFDWTSSAKHVEARTGSPRGQGRSEGQEGVATAKDQGLQDTWRKLQRSYIFESLKQSSQRGPVHPFMIDEWIICASKDSWFELKSPTSCNPSGHSGWSVSRWYWMLHNATFV